MRPNTRASMNDILTGNNVYIGAIHADAIDFVNLEHDDIVESILEDLVLIAACGDLLS